MEYLAYYLIFINLITFIIWGIDKYKARKKFWRIREKYLLGLMLIGGVVGGLVGMQAFHHKIVKSSFLLKFWLIIIVWIVIFVRWGTVYL